MKKLSYLFLLFFIISNCSLNKVQKKHGVRNLQIKQQKLIILESNKNDIKKILGPPSSVSTFDNDLWIFIEREVTHERLIKLGKEKLVKNNVLFLELDSKGILIKKDFFDINEMNETDISSLSTEAKYSKKSFIYDFLSSMRQKINDPLGKRKKP